MNKNRLNRIAKYLKMNGFLREASLVQQNSGEQFEAPMRVVDTWQDPGPVLDKILNGTQLTEAELARIKSFYIDTAGGQGERMLKDMLIRRLWSTTYSKSADQTARKAIANHEQISDLLYNKSSGPPR